MKVQTKTLMILDNLYQFQLIKMTQFNPIYLIFLQSKNLTNHSHIIIKMNKQEIQAIQLKNQVKNIKKLNKTKIINNKKFRIT